MMKENLSTFPTYKTIATSIFLLLVISEIFAQKVTVFNKYADLESSIFRSSDTVYVVNFWATWCAPCIKELPHFERLNTENEEVKVVLVSLDFEDQFETRLLPFIEYNDIRSKVIFLSDINHNNWLPKVDEEWSGSIPATLIVKGNNRLFHEGDFKDFDELNDFVKQYISKNKLIK